MKKIIKIVKTVIKAIFGILGGIIGLAALLCAVTLAWSLVQMSRGEVTEALPVVPDDFVPEVRIVAFTDTHNENENVKQAINAAYALFEDDGQYYGVDAFFGLGDFTSVGGENDFIEYKKALDECVREDTIMINVLGNHEMKTAEAPEYFVKHFGHEVNTVTEINGFTCIAFSGERWLTEWTVSPESVKWLSSEVEKAEEKAGDRPIFVFQHPHPFGTVYGSTIWCNPQMNMAFNGHNKVVDFSGHSHFPMNDPRSINQSDYTSVGVGAMARFELDKNYVVGQHPEGYEDAIQFAVIEADSTGRVRIRGYDVISGTFFCDYFIENVNDRSTFAYTYKNLKAHDTAPVFPSEINVTSTANEDGGYRVEFTEADAAEGFVVQNYTVKISDSKGKELYKEQFVADYYIIDEDNTSGINVPAGILETGKDYLLEITAESAYHKTQKSGEIVFTVPGEIVFTVPAE